MAKPSKQPAIIETESLSADEEKQMSEMKDNDRLEPAIDEASDDKNTNVTEPELKEEPKVDNKQKTVPHAALEEERQRRKGLEKQLEERSIEQARLDERLKLINEALSTKEQPKQPQRVEIPDPTKDALGALNALTNNYQLTEQENQLLRNNVTQMQNNQLIQQQLNDVIQKGTQAAIEYKKTAPDYDDAFNHLYANRLQELKHMGHNDGRAQQLINEEKLIITAQAINNGQNPAEVFYNIAKTRGYAVKAAAAQTNAADQITLVSQGQKANASLSNINGGAPNAGNFINAKDLSTMSDAQFAKLYTNLNGDPDAMKKVFGG